MRRPLSRLLVATTVVGACVVPASAWSATTAQFGGTTGSTPSGIAVDAAGNVYTSNYGSNSVTRISADGLTTAQFGGTTGNSPTGIAVDSAGNVFTSNTRYSFGAGSSNNVTRITAGGLVTTQQFGGLPVADSPYGITVDSAGNVFTANYGDWNVSKITAGGVLTNSFGPTAPYGVYPRAVATDSAGNIFLASTGDDSVTRLSANGASKTVPFGGSTGDDPRSIAVDSAGNVYTANYVDSTVTRISATGASTVQAWGPAGDGPTGIAIDPDGNVYTSNEGDRSVWRISADGSTSRQFGGQTGLNPSGIAIDRDGNVFTSNAGDNTVTRISPDRGPLLYAPTAFPTASAGVASTLTVTATNSSTEGSVRPTAITASGADVAITGGTCAVGTRIPPRGTCTVVLSWTPPTAGALSGAFLSILYPGGPGAGEVTDLTGTTQAQQQSQASSAVSALTATVLPSRTRVVSGQPVRIGIRARNGGGAAAEDVTSCLGLPSHLVVMRAPGARRSGRTVCFGIGTIAAGTSVTRTITARAVSTRPAAGYITASVRSAGVNVVQAPRTALVIRPRAVRTPVTG